MDSWLFYLPGEPVQLHIQYNCFDLAIGGDEMIVNSGLMGYLLTLEEVTVAGWLPRTDAQRLLCQVAKHGETAQGIAA
ncbi:MAG TPA: hypothetical protein VLS96_02120 [Nodosilinea sp.]|nr:hypothetical protein [Nodosilinea sp.]